MASHWGKALQELTELYGPDAAAEMVLNDSQIQADEEFRAWVLSLIRSRARLLARNNTREIEKEVLSSTNATAADRQRLADETFTLPSGERVFWLKATVDEHMERIAYQQSLIGMIQRDVDRHLVAIKMIEDAGVKCLADLDGGTV